MLVLQHDLLTYEIVGYQWGSACRGKPLGQPSGEDTGLDDAWWFTQDELIKVGSPEEWRALNDSIYIDEHGIYHRK